jgi:N utilization substance protein B
LQALYQWQMTGDEAGDIIRQFLVAQDFKDVDKPLFRQLVRGVAGERDRLAAALQPFMDRPFAQCDVMEQVVLLIAAWQLSHDPGLPPQVVMDESIELAKRFGSGQSPVYVNGVLDKACAGWPPPGAGT